MRKPILVISDIHLHDPSAHATMKNGKNSRMLDVVNALYKAVAVGKSEGCETVVVEGDWFHVRGSVKPSIMRQACNVIQHMVDSGMSVILIPGNHDMEDYSDGDLSIYPLQFIGRESQVIIPETPERINLNGWDFLCIPYIHKTSVFKDTYDKLCGSIDDDCVVLMHQGIDDFKPNGSVPNTSITNQWLQERHGGWIFSGHYHTPKHKDKIVSPGSIIQHSFNDAGHDHGCWLLYPDDKLTFHKLPYPEFEVHAATKLSEAKKIDVSNKIIRWEVQTSAQASKLVNYAKENGAYSASAIIKKEYTTAHEEKVEPASPLEVAEQYINLDSNNYDEERKVRLMSLLNEIILNGER